MSFDLLTFITTKVYPGVLVLFFFGLAIFIHELGHFLVAKRRGLKIERFSIGFGPKIFGWTKDGIEYRVSWFPFGGYVALPQMAPMEAVEGKTETKAEELPPVSPVSKILVALAGPVMNLLLALVMACILWQVGLPTPVNPPIIGWVDRGSVEEQKGMRPGDRIVKIDDTEVKTWEQVMEAVAFTIEPTVRVVYERDGHQRFECLVDPTFDKELRFKSLRLSPVGHPFAQELISGRPAQLAGVQAGDKFLKIENTRVASAKHLRELLGVRADQPTHITVERNGHEVVLVVTPEYDPDEKAGRIGVKLGEDFPYVLQRPGPTPLTQFTNVLGQMGKLVRALWHHDKTGITPKGMTGPVGIMGGFWYEITGGGFLRGMNLAVLLNINLAILNLLPLPVLDGGHILLSILESFRRKPLNARIVYASTMTFAVLLISFMLYVTWFDLDRFVFWRFKNIKSTETNETISTTHSNQP